MVPWELFEASNVKKGASKRKPIVSIQTRGDLHLNAAALALIDNPEWVVLYYDKDENRIGIDPAAARHDQERRCHASLVEFRV